MMMQRIATKTATVVIAILYAMELIIVIAIVTSVEIEIITAISDVVVFVIITAIGITTTEINYKNFTVKKISRDFFVTILLQ